MITIEQAIAARYRQEFHHVSLKNADKTPVRCRVNGKCQTWKTRPTEFKLPVKHGLKDCFYITERNAHEWCCEPLDDYSDFEKGEANTSNPGLLP